MTKLFKVQLKNPSSPSSPGNKTDLKSFLLYVLAAGTLLGIFRGFSEYGYMAVQKPKIDRYSLPDMEGQDWTTDHDSMYIAETEVVKMNNSDFDVSSAEPRYAETAVCVIGLGKYLLDTAASIKKYSVDHLDADVFVSVFDEVENATYLDLMRPNRTDRVFKAAIFNDKNFNAKDFYYGQALKYGKVEEFHHFINRPVIRDGTALGGILEVSTGFGGTANTGDMSADDGSKPLKRNENTSINTYVCYGLT
eukprot:CAMPEP_0184478512 /NCGR_PEP_ID=MMETSP0113_2-20130426/517_1 /TAXON_ID=91329 /ORGANISM="Norrisiella sphaerica, Strain BC52" /LENGTH=249 /DNA_ID=CAMNT_0026856327 /DNA_START=318 /DNA_END=1068 /DNA_ORIENTATION=-